MGVLNEVVIKHLAYIKLSEDSKTDVGYKVYNMPVHGCIFNSAHQLEGEENDLFNKYRVQGNEVKSVILQIKDLVNGEHAIPRIQQVCDSDKDYYNFLTNVEKGRAVRNARMDDAMAEKLIMDIERNLIRLDLTSMINRFMYTDYFLSSIKNLHLLGKHRIRAMEFSDSDLDSIARKLARDFIRSRTHDSIPYSNRDTNNLGKWLASAFKRYFVGSPEDKTLYYFNNASVFVDGEDGEFTAIDDIALDDVDFQTNEVTLTDYGEWNELVKYGQVCSRMLYFHNIGKNGTGIGGGKTYALNYYDATVLYDVFSRHKFKEVKRIVDKLNAIANFENGNKYYNGVFIANDINVSERGRNLTDFLAKQTDRELSLEIIDADIEEERINYKNLKDTCDRMRHCDAVQGSAHRSSRTDIFSLDRPRKGALVNYYGYEACLIAIRTETLINNFKKVLDTEGISILDIPSDIFKSSTMQMVYKSFEDYMEYFKEVQQVREQMEDMDGTYYYPTDELVCNELIMRRVGQASLTSLKDLLENKPSEGAFFNIDVDTKIIERYRVDLFSRSMELLQEGFSNLYSLIQSIDPNRKIIRMPEIALEDVINLDQKSNVLEINYPIKNILNFEPITLTEEQKDMYTSVINAVPEIGKKPVDVLTVEELSDVIRYYDWYFKYSCYILKAYRDIVNISLIGENGERSINMINLAHGIEPVVNLTNERRSSDKLEKELNILKAVGSFSKHTNREYKLNRCWETIYTELYMHFSCLTKVVNRIKEQSDWIKENDYVEEINRVLINRAKLALLDDTSFNVNVGDQVRNNPYYRIDRHGFILEDGEYVAIDGYYLHKLGVFISNMEGEEFLNMPATANDLNKILKYITVTPSRFELKHQESEEE